MSNENENTRRDFLKGAVMGLGFGTLATMGVFS